jgi:hypothetical protein
MGTMRLIATRPSFLERQDVRSRLRVDPGSLARSAGRLAAYQERDRRQSMNVLALLSGVIVLIAFAVKIAGW